jgi:O-antigen ligase
MSGENFGKGAPLAQGASPTPWFFFLFLTLVFLFAQHDWYFSLSGADDFLKSLNELTDSLEQGNLLRRVAFASLAVFAAACILKRRFRRFRVKAPLGWLILAFLLWASFSLAWSDEPAFTARRLGVLAGVCLGAFVASRRFSPRDTTLWVLVSTFAYLNIGLASEIVLGTFHPLSGGYRFAGTLHPNVQGMNCAFLFMSAVFLLTEKKRSRRVLFAIAAEALVFLVLTKSRTSFVLALSAPLLCRFLAARVSRKRAAVLAVVSVACFLTLLGDLVLPTLQEGILLGRGSNEVDTLTGRVPLWEQALGYVSERPVQGYGYDSFWTEEHVMDFWKEQSWAVPDAHSAYIESALGLGVVGGLLFLLIVAVAIKRGLAEYKATQDAGYGLFGSVLIFAALNGLVESAFVQPSYVTFVCMLVLADLGFSGSRTVAGRYGVTGGAARPRDRKQIRGIAAGGAP